MRGVLDDWKMAWRSLQTSPRFTVGLILVLALGIGSSLAVFTTVDAVLFRRLPLPPAEQGQVVRVLGTEPRGDEAWHSTSYPVFVDYREQATSFALLAAYETDAAFQVADVGAQGASERSERVVGGIVSGTYFQVLDARPALGRLLGPADDLLPGAHPVAVLSYPFWQRRFAGDPAVLGRLLRVNTETFTIVGVAGRGFLGADLESFPQVFVPMAMAASAMPGWAFLDPLDNRRFSWVRTVGRLEPGVSMAAAEADLQAIAARRAAASPAGEEEPFAGLRKADDIALGLGEDAERPRRLSTVLAAAVVLLLVIAVANASGLLLARAGQRRREAALRAAIGAGRGRIARWVACEALLLSTVAGALGLALAAALTRVIGHYGEGVALPMGAALELGTPRVLLIALLLSAVTGATASLAPALHAAGGRDLAHELTATRGAGRQRGRAGGRQLLLLLQAALSTALLAGACLLLRSLERAATADLGFEPRGAAVASVDLALSGYDKIGGAAQWPILLAAVRGTPGVASAALGKSVPVQSQGMRTTVKPAGYEFQPGEDEAVQLNPVSPGYFATLGMPLLAGRDFDERDRTDSSPVAVVNEAFAARFWPGQDAIGKRIGGIGEPEDAEVIGVVGNARYRSVRENPEAALFLPSTQMYLPGMTLVARAADGFAAGALVPALERAVASVDPGLPVFRARSLEDHIGATLTAERAAAALFTGAALVALCLVAAGLYALVSYVSALRTREFGVRVALGAQRSEIIGEALRESMLLVGLGTALGLALALSLARGLAALLYGVSSADTASFVAAAGALAAVAAAAGWWPARRASRLDPVVALRGDG
jgi:predicted permease